MGTTLVARSAAVSSLLAVAAAVSLVVGVLTAATPSRAAGFDVGEAWTWSTNELLLPSGTAKAARVERLPGDRVAALMVVDGSAYDEPVGDVLVTRVREATGTWGAEQVVPLGAEAPAPQTFDSFADSAGRIVVIWAVKGAVSGQWPVRSVSRTTAGVWSAPEELYVARTDGALADLNEIRAITPRLVPTGDSAALAWATVVGAPSSRVDVADNPFRARRWTAGAWASPVVSGGYDPSGEGGTVQPFSPDSVQVWADPDLAVRPTDGRISFVYSLSKHRVTHSLDHPLGDDFPPGPNAANVWDGIAERPWDASSTTAWVMHLDPGQGWGAPAKLVIDSSPVNCATVDLPPNPPLVAYWQEWKDYSDVEGGGPGIDTSCPGEDSRGRSAFYHGDGQLRIELSYKSDPSAKIVLNQFLSRACDDPGPGNTYRFCFDTWGSTDWGIDWPTARIGIAPGADRPAEGAVAEGAWPLGTSVTVSASSGSVTIHEAPGVASPLQGAALRFVRAGSDVLWTPDPANSSTLRVQRVFAHDNDVAVFYYRGNAVSTTDCGMAVQHGSSTSVAGPLPGCVAAANAHRSDVVQLANGRLVWINGEGSGSPVRVYGPTTEPTDPTPTDTTSPTPTNPSPSSPAPSSPAPSSPAPSAPAPSPSAPSAPAPVPPPPATTFTATSQPKVTGKLKVGKTLAARPGTWVPTPTGVRYRWMANGKAIPRATKPKLRLVSKLKGKRISVAITLTRSGTATTTRTVKARGKVG